MRVKRAIIIDGADFHSARSRLRRDHEPASIKRDEKLFVAQDHAFTIPVSGTCTYKSDFLTVMNGPFSKVVCGRRTRQSSPSHSVISTEIQPLTGWSLVGILSCRKSFLPENKDSCLPLNGVTTTANSELN